MGVLLLIAAAFIAHLGIQAAARSASVVFAFFVAMLVIVLFATVPDFEAENYYTVPLTASSLWQGISDGVSRSDEVVVLVLIMPYLRDKICKAVYGFSGAKLIVIEGIIICCMLLLGGYMSASPFSFFTMCKYANTAFIERLDAVYLFVWTCMGAIKLSLYSIALKPLYENVVSDESKLLCLCCLPFIIGGIPALIFSCKNQMIIPFLDIHVTFYAILLLGFLLPLVVYFLRRCKREKN
ncbi:MAG: GerAB/ArcD/ProY family transporter [Ruminococcus sp.]|nr:GerAB/ArcD/ProY family transporter [Ruminococcus sp.]